MLTGQCGCGAVTYRLMSEPMSVHCCHCRDCQRQTGSAFVLNALIEAERVNFHGPVAEATFPSGSGKGQVVTRCAVCGVALFSAYLIREGKLRNVRVGTLDQPSACPPDVHIFTASKQPWVMLAGDIPAFEGFYDIAQVWPQDRLARWAALFGP
ncbi:GFA family protein [Sedimentitalea nanhaiensis]|uniref:Uncharacterized conserved protein n=1 Tax=Sedimentitalea nanhaiensis TaxID=999627 RepID=A0A1I7DD07_9RHOB|nr:GFA family protein [Sedimentitalea nanhaiensis]SFU09569.1 Uncharacterized conserved protein [Sedimentitalea nanhaiensis]